MSYSFGIDLGTTNCALALSNESSGEVISVAIPQRVAEGSTQALFTLPSYIYIPPLKGELPSCGVYAREKQGEQLGRVISSAKSWLAEPSVDPQRKFLPWSSEVVEGVDLMSPVEASAFYLKTIKATIEEKFGSISSHQIVITVPASFDERACELTLAAAAAAGYPDNTLLLEEPQAAFYRYISTAEVPRTVTNLLVCDVGGGTTDLSLFRVDWIPGKIAPELERVRVGNHLLLGGDNLDLEVARLIRSEFEARGKSLSRSQWQRLLSQSQKLKEQALSSGALGEVTISLPDSGRSLFRSTLSHKIQLPAIREHLLAQFFPIGPLPQLQQSEEQQAGALHYAADVRFTGQVEKFLKNSFSESTLTVDAVLFVGGSLIPAVLRERILQQIKFVQGTAPLELSQPELELAVSLGAAEFVRRRKTSEGRIRSGQARSLYLKLKEQQYKEQQYNEQRRELLCLLPLGIETDESILVSPPSGAISARVNSPVQFELYGSTTRSKDRPGDIVEGDNGDIQRIALLRTMLNLSGAESRLAELPVEVSAQVNELGRLELCLYNRERQRKWNLRFDLNATGSTAPQSEVAGATPKELLKLASPLIDQVFGTRGESPNSKAAKGLLRALEEVLKLPRKDWDLLLLRGLWGLLERGMTKKNRSKDHELTWLSLAGFTLRPGMGVELDNERIERLWKVFNLGLSFPKEKAHQVQWWTMWRRVALGLNAERQQALFKLALPKPNNSGEIKALCADPERLRLVSSLESLDAAVRTRLFEVIWDNYRATPTEVSAWALARLGARNLLSGNIDTVIQPLVVEKFIEQALELDWREHKALISSVIRCSERSKDRALEIPSVLREQVLKKLNANRIEEQLFASVIEYLPQSAHSMRVAFGEELPPGMVFRGS